MDVVLALVGIIFLGGLCYYLYVRLVAAGGYDARYIGNHMGQRHWERLNKYEDEPEDN
ncbi:MAG: hypothetical protein ACOCX5_03180 [Chloroflexota bacterium]